MITGKYPNLRLRRSRKYAWSRKLVQESSLSYSDLILPIFLIEGKNKKESIKSMPNVFRYSVDKLNTVVGKAIKKGIPMVALFPYTSRTKKDEKGSEALNPDNLVCRGIKFIKKKFKNKIGIMCDVALDPYTSHGHDGLLKKNNILNDKTVEILTKQAVLQAKMGCDVIAPSDMMDGRVSIIRKYLDSSSFYHVGIMAYSAKFCSAYYGPFREAIGSSTAKPIDKSTYQLNPANKTEAERELLLDAAEGADILMVKPAEPYLDIIMHAKNHHCLPVAAYQVSGEYSRLWAASSLGWLDLDECAKESLLSIKRAGADLILTYFAERIAPQL